MKKVFLFFAVASLFVACNKPAQTTEQTSDSVATETVVPADSAAKVMTDSAATTVANAADSVAKAVK